ncbi:13133_t:CDS:2, partial [Funneliformis geosporum]
DIMSICSRFEVLEDNNRSILHIGFQNIGGFQNVIGAINGTHFILTEAPIQDPIAYFTRKKRYAIQCQGIVDFKGIFINYVIGWPGSVHDVRVYSNSDFYLNRTEYIQDEDYVL